MTRQQTWSKSALTAVEGWAKDANKAKFKTLCMKMPALIGQSGLVQAVVFMQARSGTEGRRFVEALATTYLGKSDKDIGTTFLKSVQEAELPAYLAMSRDVIAIATWYQRFAQSVMADVEE